VGYLTPPIGLNLLLSSYRFGKPIPQVLRSVLPIVAVMSIGVTRHPASPSSSQSARWRRA